MVCKESDITYEELIRSSSSNKLLWLKRFRRTLPMRNWYTHPQVFYILVASKLLIRRTLPMRNWYIFEKRFQIIQRIIIGKKSDITYEELIREKVVLMMVSSSLEASDITYEELILSRLWLAPHTEYHLSDITYEELIQTADWRIVLRRFPSRVGHYLWGIDTFSNPKSSSGNGFFSSDITYEELIRK